MDVRLSVVIPAFNEEKTISHIVRSVSRIPFVWELIIIDDGSTDRTPEILDGLREPTRVKVFRHERNRGKGASLHTGFCNVTGNVVLIQDADLEYNPKDYERLIHPFINGELCVIYGSRYIRNPSAEWWHTLGNRAMTFFFNLLNRTHLTDMETCYKVFPADVITRLPLRYEDFCFEPEVTSLLTRRGVRIREIQISYNRRGYSEGKKIGLLDAVKTFIAILHTSLIR